jgi:hypothetical protein
MHSQDQLPSLPLSSQTHPQTPPRRLRLTRVRGWLRSRTGRVVIPLVAFCAGIVLGMAALVLYGLTGEGQIVTVPSSEKGQIVVEADTVFLVQLVTKDLRDSGMPGHIDNVQVELAQGDQMTVHGDEDFSVLGLGVAKHFTFVVQPYVSSCFLQVHIVHADFSHVPITGFAHIFENTINQQLQMKPEGLPSGFHYCTTEVRTEPSAMYVTYAATPL